MGRVFLSYSSSDRARADELVEHLGVAGLDVWYDRRVRGGQAWWDEILGQMRSCDAVLVLVTSACLDSPACRAELDYAVALGRTIVPIETGEVSPESTGPVLRHREWIAGATPAELALGIVGSVGSLTAGPLPDPLPAPPPAPPSYLADVVDRIDATYPLDGDDQERIVATLRGFLDAGRTPSDVAELARRLLLRTDLAPGPAARAGALLEDARAKAAAHRAPAAGGAAAPVGAATPPGRRSTGVLVAGAVAAVLAVVLVAVVVRGASGGGKGEPNVAGTTASATAATGNTATSAAATNTTTGATGPAASTLAVTSTAGTGTAAGDATTGATTTGATTTVAVPAPVSLDVPGDRDWTDTGVTLAVGDVVDVVAGGGVTHSPDDAVPVDPDGDPRPALRVFNVVASANHAALIGRIGTDGEPFPVGTRVRLTATAAGRLFLGINDVGVDGNGGAFRATVTRVARR